ncbi:MAG: hypothetical protein VKO26_02820 [Cyanobacteriota bacterium]|nr:hypothetical protein [Cyanobacteriota bacterium]
MLICTDCGQPVDQRETSAMARQRVWGALALVVMALLSGSMLLLASIYESRTAGSLEDALDQAEERSGKERDKEDERLLLDPSDLIKPPGTVKVASPAPVAAPMPTAVPAASRALAPPPPPPALPQQQNQQPDASERQP